MTPGREPGDRTLLHRLRRILPFLLLGLALAAPTDPAAAREAAAEGEVVDLGALVEEKDEASDETAAPGAAASEDSEGSVAFGTIEQLESGSGVRVKTICTNCNQASLTVNGITGDERVRVTFDGVPTAGGLATAYFLSQLPSELVGWSHVTRGPGTVLTDGGAVGGEIAFHSVARDRRRAFLDVQVGDWSTRSLKLAGADRWGPVGALVFAQATTVDGVDSNGDGFSEVAEFERFSAQGLFDFDLPGDQVLTLGALAYGEDQLEGPGAPWPPIDTYTPEDVFINWRRFSLGWEADLPSGVHLSLKGRWGRRWQHQYGEPFPGLGDKTLLTVEDERTYARFQAEAPVGVSGFLTGGVGFRYQRTSAWLTQDVQPQWVVDGVERHEAFLQYDRSVGARWDYSVGARWDEFVLSGATLTTVPAQPRVTDPDLRSSWLSPRAQVHFRPNDKVVLGMSLGRGAAPPTPIYEKICCGAKLERSREAKVERWWSWQGQVEVHPTRDMRLTTTLFWTDFDDYLERVLTEDAQGYVPKYALANFEQARVRGIDLIHDMRFADNRYNVGWTYTWTDHEDGTGARLLYLPEHAASGYFRYDDTRRGTEISLDVRWQGPVTHFRTKRSRSEPLELRRSEDFVTADVRFEQRIGKKGWSVYAGVQNLTDYVQNDLEPVDRDENGVLDYYERCFDWGPITGRYVFGGVRFEL